MRSFFGVTFFLDVGMCNTPPQDHKDPQQGRPLSSLALSPYPVEWNDKDSSLQKLHH